MKKLETHTEKICGFYVSDLHLTTMILPYINKKIKENFNIVTILQNNIEDNIAKLLSRLNLKNDKEILKIDWKACKDIKNNELEKKLACDIIKNKNNIVFISGSKEYIDKINKILDKWIFENKNSLGTVKIINCYEVTEFNESIHEILDVHDKILNTSGEKYIYEVFEGYQNVEEIS